MTSSRMWSRSASLTEASSPWSGMTVARCSKHRDAVVRVISDQAELHTAYSELFEKLDVVVECLYRVSPLSVLENLPGETDLLENTPGTSPDSSAAAASSSTAAASSAPASSSSESTSQETELEISELDFLTLLIKDLQHSFIKSFPDLTPTPKQHLLCFHAVTFLQKWLSLGMFSEQAVESAHALFNKAKRKYRSLGQVGAGKFAISLINLRQTADRQSFKMKGKCGEKRKRED